MSGLSPTGFDAKRLEDLKEDLEQLLEGKYGVINKDSDSVLGQLIGLISKALTEVWELDEGVYNSQYPSTAEGISLDHSVDYVGVQRLAATKSNVNVQATGDQGTLIPSGRIVSVVGTQEQFDSIADVTIDKADAVSLLISVSLLQDSTDYTITVNSVAITFTSDGDATALEIIAGLKSAVDAGSSPVIATDNGDETLALDTDDFNVSFDGLVTSNLSIDIVTTNMEMTSSKFDGIVALAGTLTTIETSVSGWDSANNALDADIGRAVETDTALRIRREQSLQIAGAGTVEAIRARLLEITGVTGVKVLENDTDITDGSGRPPHSFESVVSGGDEQEIADEIWEVKPAGIQSHGDISKTVIDSQAVSHTIKFSRADDIFLHVRITLTKSLEESYPTDGDQAIIDGVVELGDTYDIDDDVIVQQFFGPVYEIPGIVDAVIEIATSATSGGPPGAFQTTNLAISDTEIAVFDSTRVTIL